MKAKTILLTISVLFSLAGAVAAQDDAAKPKVSVQPKNVDSDMVEMVTSQGTIYIELYSKQAPISVANFKRYIASGHFKNTVFHRVINNFMIQGGGFEKKADGEIAQKKPGDPIKNEASNGLSNDRGTLAMARTSEPDSASAQFFINVKDNKFLNRSGDLPRQAGYAVFGKVANGMDVVDKIKAVKTGVRKLKALGPGGELIEQPMRDVPITDVVIKSMRMVDPKSVKPADEKKPDEKKP